MRCLYCKNKVIKPRKVCDDCKKTLKEENIKNREERRKARDGAWRKLSPTEQEKIMLKFTKDYMKNNQSNPFGDQ